MSPRQAAQPRDGAWQAPSVVRVRLSGDLDAAAELLTNAGAQMIERSAPYPNRRDPGSRVYLNDPHPADRRPAMSGGGEAWIGWAAAREFCDAGAQASTSEMAILDLAVALGENRCRLSIMGAAHSRWISAAVAQAVGAVT
jgi:hypothetical protein